MKDALVLKQCETNCLALFVHYDLPRLQTVVTLADRTLFSATQEFLEALFGIVPQRFEIWRFNRNHGTTAIRGWRERVARWSMQLIEHEGLILEADFDSMNPNFGLAPLIGHAGEVLSHKLTGRKTDSFTIMAALRRRGIDVSDVRQA